MTGTLSGCEIYVASPDFVENAAEHTETDGEMARTNSCDWVISPGFWMTRVKGGFKADVSDFLKSRWRMLGMPGQRVGDSAMIARPRHRALRFQTL